MGTQKTVKTFSIQTDTFERIKALASQTKRTDGSIVDLAIAGMTPLRLNRIARMLSEQNREDHPVEPTTPLTEEQTIRRAGQAQVGRRLRKARPQAA